MSERLQHDAGENMIGNTMTVHRARWRAIGSGMILIVLMFSRVSAAQGEVRIDLKPYVGKLRQVTVRIADHDRQFLFDTAGGHTIISPAIAVAIGCKPSGRSVGFRMNGEKFETPLCQSTRYSIGAFSPGSQTVGVLDLMSFLPKELPPVDGLISLKSFEGRSIALDLGANRLTVFTRRIHLERRRTFPCRAATGTDGSEYTLFAAIRRKEHDYWFEVDSANLDKVLIAPHAAPGFGLEASSEGESAEIGISLGSARPVNVFARIADIIYDGALNAAFLEQGVLRANLTQQPNCSWNPR